MSALHRNDKTGEHAPSYYAASVKPSPVRLALKGAVKADVAILGAGYTGLWAALTLARAGRRVVVVDAHRVGFGASGRNGGQVHGGYNCGQVWLHERLGEARALALWDLAEAGRAQLKDFCATRAPEAQFRPGIAHGDYTPADARGAAEEAAFLSKHYGHEVEHLDQSAFQALVKSPRYMSGSLDHAGGHLHPLAYAQALAREAEAAGAVIYETTEVTQIVTRPTLRFATAHGTLEAGHGILAGNGYMPALVPSVAARIMPINSFIGATEPLPDRWKEVLAEDIAVSDSRFVVNYYRFSTDRRFLFGGRESYSLGFPRDIATALVARMEALFPQIKGVAMDYVWGGTLGITMTRLPYLARVTPTLLSGGGFSGHGVAMSGIAGRVMAEAILGQDDGMTTLEALPVPAFPGGRFLRAPILTLAMTWFALRDRLGI